MISNAYSYNLIIYKVCSCVKLVRLLLRVNFLASVSDLLGFIVRIIGWNLMSANRALVVLLEPITDALFVKEVTTRHLDSLVSHVLTTDSATRMFKFTRSFISLAVSFGNLDLRKVVNCFF